MNLPEKPWPLKILTKIIGPSIKDYRTQLVSGLKEKVNNEVKLQYSVMWSQLEILAISGCITYLAGHSLLSRRLGSLVLWFLLIFNVKNFKRTVKKLRSYYRWIQDEDIATAVSCLEITLRLVVPCFIPLAICLLLSFSARAFLSSSFDLFAPWTESPSTLDLLQQFFESIFGSASD
jgi:hypothetical protein